MGQTLRITKPRLAAVAVVMLTMGVVLIPNAQAQDPYGATTTTVTDSPDAVASCGLSTTQGAAGSSVTATVLDVPSGSLIRILFGGVEVGQATAPVQGGGSDAQIGFTVPALAAGSYDVIAVGDTFSTSCIAGGGGFGISAGGGTEVLGNQVSRDGGSGGGGLGSLPRTGVAIALLLSLALALLLVGRALVDASRRRQRRLAREQALSDNPLAAVDH